MISKEEVLHNIKFIPKDSDKIEYLINYINQPTPLDSEVEELLTTAINFANNLAFDIDKNLLKSYLKYFKQALRQGEEYKNHYELYYKLAKETQFKLNAIEEVVNPIAEDYLISMGEESKRRLAIEIKQILGKK